MAAYDLEEQEQLSAIKAWWEKNGKAVTWLITAAAVVSVGAQGWRWYQSNRSAQAGAFYASVLHAADKKDAVKVRAFSGDLVSKYSGVMAADLGAIVAAKSEAEAGDLKSASLKLQWVVDNSKDQALRDLARLRLAEVQVDAKLFDAALKTVEVSPDEAFLARFEDIRGDALLAKGVAKDAAAAYKRALAAYDKVPETDGSVFRNVIETKLEALGGA